MVISIKNNQRWFMTVYSDCKSQIQLHKLSMQMTIIKSSSIEYDSVSESTDECSLTSSRVLSLDLFLGCILLSGQYGLSISVSVS